MAAGSGQERANEMASEKTEEWQEPTVGAAANADEGWQRVADEDKIDLETIGDGFIGTYVSKDTVGANGMVQFHFQRVTDLKGKPLSERAFINGTRDLANKLAVVPFGRQTRVQWVSEMPTGQITPMRVFDVQWR
jgi:hypothetical protein